MLADEGGSFDEYEHRLLMVPATQHERDVHQRKHWILNNKFLYRFTRHINGQEMVFRIAPPEELDLKKITTVYQPEWGERSILTAAGLIFMLLFFLVSYILFQGAENIHGFTYLALALPVSVFAALLVRHCHLQSKEVELLRIKVVDLAAYVWAVDQAKIRKERVEALGKQLREEQNETSQTQTERK